MAGRLRKRRWRKRGLPRFRKSRIPLEAYERKLILADLKAIGGKGSWHDFERHVPGRYHRDHFDTAMNRLSPYDVKYRGRSKIFGAKIWSLSDYDRWDGDAEQSIIKLKSEEEEKP